MIRRYLQSVVACAALFTAASASAGEAPAQLGPRPFFLVDDMDAGKLKNELQACMDIQKFRPSKFSIGHRGAAFQFPEHTKESYVAAARMGAGIIECDVTFTKDKKLVCRHDQCDLHTTTDILARPALAAKCTQPFVPANPGAGTAAKATCCTSDITLAEFKTLCGKMDGFNPKGTTIAEYMAGTPTFRTDTYSTCGTLLTHAESIKLIDGLGRDFTPEAKTPRVAMPFDGYSQSDFVQAIINDYKNAGIKPSRVWPQSFLYSDILYWLAKEPKFGKQAVFLESVVDVPGGYDIAVDKLDEERQDGVNIVAPPMWVLVTLDANGKIVPSSYTKKAKQLGFDIITWTLERSGPLFSGGGYYYQSVTGSIDNDGDTYNMLDVLAQDVGVLGVFSDWPATVTYYANCKGL